MEERLKFVLEYRKDTAESMAALCRKYGISRKTGYKWLFRYERDDPNSLQDRSRRPLSHPQATPAWMEELILDLRRNRPRWGPKKLRRTLENAYVEDAWPSLSTFANIIKRHGLVRPRRSRKRVPPFEAPFEGCDAPNDVWCADFKGQFRTGRLKCYPVTISDGFSRYLIRCEGVSRPRHREVNRVFESAFRELGLPTAIRTDNGPPFASPTLGGLSRLAVWWMRLGIRPERIQPGKPQQNGRHERMHRTLKEETAMPPATSMRAQQRRFDVFCQDYNAERPHEALALATPASWYVPSTKPYPAKLPQPEYPLGTYTFRVPDNGILAWRGQNIYLSNCLANQYVGLQRVGDAVWEVYFCSLRLGCIERANRYRKGNRYKFVRQPSPSLRCSR